MSPDTPNSQDIVTAVIVAHDGAAWLPRVMDAVATQTRPVQRVVAVDTGSTDRSGAMLAQAFGRSAVFGMDRDSGYGVAVAKALRHRAANAHVLSAGGPQEDRAEWIWLLHDDSEPAPDALERLLAGARETPAAAVFGPKIMDWSDRDILLEAGITIDRAGRRVTGIEPREVDQGQHDGDRDVLAVSSAGMLVRRDVWEQAGGFDPGMRMFREDTDFCWRVQAAGYKVRVVTGAVLYHVEATARNRREASAAPHRRRQDRRNALLVLTGNLPARPMLSALAGNLVLSALRAIFFLLAKRPSAAVDEMTAYTSVACHPTRLRAARRIRARGRQQAFARLRTQLPPGRSFRMLAEYATSTLSRTLPAEAVGSHHATEDPSDDDSLLVDSGLAQRLLTSPGVLLFLTLTVVALVAERSLLGSTPLGGGALVPAWGGVSGLWQEYFQGFHPMSIGTAASAPPYVAVLAVLATILGGKPWLAVDVLLLGCVPLAGVTAFFATRRVTSFVPARLVGALAYALLPVGMGAVAAGRLGTAVLLILLPPVAALVGRIFTAPRRRARRAAWAAGLVTAIVAAFVPLFWLITAVVMAISLVAMRRRNRILDALIVAGIPPLLLLPWTLDIATHPARLFLEAGLAGPGLAGTGPAAHLLLLSPGGPGLPPFWVTGGLALAATVAVVVSGRRRLVLAGCVVGATGLVAAAAVSRIAISQAGPEGLVRAWPGPALTVAAAGLLLAVVAAGDEVRGLLRAGRWRTPAWLAALGIGAMALSAPALAASYWVSSGVAGPVRPVTGTLLPEFVSVSSDTGLRLRTLVLQTAPDGGVTYLVLRDSDPLIGSQELGMPVSAQKALSRTVATLSAPSGSAITDQGRALAGFGIGYVLLPAPVNGALARLLDNVPGLRPVSATSAFHLWRVVDTTARVTVAESGGKVVPVPSGPVRVSGARAPAAGGTLMLAEPAGGWTATLSGRPLTPLAAPVNGWAQGFRLPPGGGTLAVSHNDIGREAVVVLEAVAVLVLAGLGLPGARAAAEAELEEPSAEQETEPGRRRASHGREPDERSRRRRSPRRGEEEPELPPGIEVPRPAMPARAFVRRAAAVPAGVRAGWPRRGGAAGAEEPFPGDEERPGEPSFPGGEPYPGGLGPRVPEQPSPVGGRRAADDPGSETIAYRAPEGDVAGRRGRRAWPGRGSPGPTAGPGGQRRDYGPQVGPGRAAGSGRAAMPDYDAAPGHDAGSGYDAALGRDDGPGDAPGDEAGPGLGTGLPSRRGVDALRGRGIGPRRVRRDNAAPGSGGYPGGRRPFGGRAAPETGERGEPQPGREPRTDREQQADREARERFSLPKRRGTAGPERAGRFARLGRGTPPAGPGGSREGPRRGTPGIPADRAGYESGGHDNAGDPAESYPADRYASGDHPSGPLPGGSYLAGRSPGVRPPGGGPGIEGPPGEPYRSGSYAGRPVADGPDSGAYDGGRRAGGPVRSGSYQGDSASGSSRDGGAHASGPYRSDSYPGGGQTGGGPAGGGYPTDPGRRGSYPSDRAAAGSTSGEGPNSRYGSGPYPAGSYAGGGGHPSGPYASGSYESGRSAGGGQDSGGYDTGGYGGGPYPGGSYPGGRSTGGSVGGAGHDDEHPSGPYPGGAYPARGNEAARQDSGHPSGPYASGSYESGGYAGSGPPSGPYPVGGPDSAGRGGDDHPSGPYPSGSYADASSPGGGYEGGGQPGGSYPVGGQRVSGRDGGRYDSGSSGDGSGGYVAGGYQTGGYRSPGQGGTDPGQAPGQGRPRSRRHARVSRPTGPGPAPQPPGSGPPGGGPLDAAADDEAELAPLPPLPPRAPRNGPWDDSGQDDQGEADW